MRSTHFARRAERTLDAKIKTDTTDAIASLNRIVVQFGAGLAGLSVIAYFVGHQYAVAYYGLLGAPWVVDMLSPARILFLSAEIIVAFATATLLSVVCLETGLANKDRLTWAAPAALLMGIGLRAISTETWGLFHTDGKYGLVTTAAVFVAFSVGISAGELIARLIESKLKWRSTHLVVVMVVFSAGLNLAPSMFATAKANIDSDPIKTTFANVLTDDAATTGKSWRIVTSLDGSSLLVSLTPQPKDRSFRVANTSQIREVKFISVEK